MHLHLLLGRDRLRLALCHGPQRLPLDPRDLARIGAAQALQLEVIANRVVEVTHRTQRNAQTTGLLCQHSEPVRWQLESGASSSGLTAAGLI